jgi:ABC-type multidrug transport system fused ATPase/permease subunit
MGLFAFLPILIIGVFYLAIVAGIFFLIYTWVNKFITLRQEQNDLLREISIHLFSKELMISQNFALFASLKNNESKTN